MEVIVHAQDHLFVNAGFDQVKELAVQFELHLCHQDFGIVGVALDPPPCGDEQAHACFHVHLEDLSDLEEREHFQVLVQWLKE